MKAGFVTISTLLFFIGFVQIVCANEIYLDPSLLAITEGESFNVEIKNLVSSTDIYAIQFDLNFNTDILEINSVIGGNLFNKSIFEYEESSGQLNVYLINNESFGVFSNATIAIINFQAIGAGESSFNFSDLIWVNSTVTNESAGLPDVLSSRGLVVISSVVTSSSSGLSSGGSGGGSGGIFLENASENNSKDKIYGGVDFETTENNLTSNEINNSKKSFITGRVFDEFFGEEGIAKSWLFWSIWVIFAILGLFGVYEKHKKHKN